MEHIHRRQQLQKHCIPVSLCTSTAPTSVGGLIGCSCAFLNGILKPATRMHATPASKFGGGERLHGSFAFVLPTEVPRASKRPGRGTIPTTPIDKRQMMRTFVEAIYRYEIHLPYIRSIPQHFGFGNNILAFGKCSLGVLFSVGGSSLC